MFPNPNKSFILALPENLVKIGLRAEALEEFCGQGGEYLDCWFKVSKFWEVFLGKGVGVKYFFPNCHELLFGPNLSASSISSNIEGLRGVWSGRRVVGHLKS